MGYMQLTDFRDEVSQALGNRGIVNDRLDRWINWGYLDIAGSIDLEELEEAADAVTVASQATVAKPTDTRVILAVVDDDNEVLLQNIDITEYYRLDRTTSGVPLKWAGLENQLYLQPTPNAIINLKILHKKDPAQLSADTDTTVLSDTWDAAVFQLTMHYAYMSLGEDQRAVLWLNRAISYIQSRATAEEIFVREPGLGLSMAVPRERLITAMEEGLRGQMGSQ